MTAAIISGLIAALSVAFSGWLAYRAQSRGVEVNHDSVVLESYDELVAHLRHEAESFRAEVRELRKEAADLLERERLCEQRFLELAADIERLQAELKRYREDG